MGGAASASKAFSFTYGYQRDMLRTNLVKSFAEDPENAQIMRNLSRLKEILSFHSHICKTAEREFSNNFLPACMESAQLEYSRLLRIYQDHMSRKSVLSRSGNVACPLGHHCEGVKSGKCVICEKSFDLGHLCSYCEYAMCEPCSFIYCLGTFRWVLNITGLL